MCLDWVLCDKVTDHSKVVIIIPGLTGKLHTRNAVPPYKFAVGVESLHHVTVSFSFSSFLYSVSTLLFHAFVFRW